MAKRVNIGVFHILKSVVDFKVAKAKPLAESAKQADAELPGLNVRLQGLRDWEASISHYQTPRYEEGEDTPADLERKIEIAKAAPSVGSVPAHNSSININVSLFARFEIEITFFMCEEKVDKLCRILCSSPISAKTFSNG